MPSPCGDPNPLYNTYQHTLTQSSKQTNEKLSPITLYFNFIFKLRGRMELLVLNMVLCMKAHLFLIPLILRLKKKQRPINVCYLAGINRMN